MILDEASSSPAHHAEIRWDHSSHIVDFVKAVVQDLSLMTETHDRISAPLYKLVQALQGSTSHGDTFFLSPLGAVAHDDDSMPPQEAVVAILRWARSRSPSADRYKAHTFPLLRSLAHQDMHRIDWVSRVLPLEKFAEICRKVYFAVDEYADMDFILANGYLAYLFGEHAAVSGRKDYQEHSQICRENLHHALSRLPLLLPASMETIAALTLGTFYAIEKSKATVAWTFTSTAADFCQRLGYHRLQAGGDDKQPSQVAQERQFWMVYAMEKSLSLRLGRSSNIRDSDITLSLDSLESRGRFARIQGKAYDELFCPVGLARPAPERILRARELAGHVHEILDESRLALLHANSTPAVSESDPMRAIYIQCDMVCRSSFLSLVLRAASGFHDSLSSVSEECIAVARETLDMHLECMTAVRNCRDPSMVTKYTTWAIVHTPFDPFSILFTHTVQCLDHAGLERLECFASSLRPDATSPGSITHPHQLYELLCRAARLYLESNANIPSQELPTDLAYLGNFSEVGTGELGLGEGVPADSASGELPSSVLTDWYYDKQQLMGLLDENVMFE